MKLYRVKYTLEKVVKVEANNPQEAEEIAASLEDFNYDFFKDSLKAEELQDKTITTAMYFKSTGLAHVDRKIVKDLPNEEQAFENVESLEILQQTKDFIEVRLTTFNLDFSRVVEIIEDICAYNLNGYGS